MLDLTVLPFALVFLAEFGDKSQLVTLSFTTEGNTPLNVLLGVSLGLGGVTLLGIVGGTLLYSFLPLSLIQVGVAVIFFFFGGSLLYMLWREQESTPAQKEDSFSSPQTTTYQKNKPVNILKIAATLFLMELGDKTQLLIIALVASTPSPVIVGIFCFCGLLAGNILVVLLGKTLHQRISPRTIRFLSAVLFLIFGYLTLMEIFGIMIL